MHWPVTSKIAGSNPVFFAFIAAFFVFSEILAIVSKIQNYTKMPLVFLLYIHYSLFYI